MAAHGLGPALGDTGMTWGSLRPLRTVVGSAPSPSYGRPSRAIKVQPCRLKLVGSCGPLPVPFVSRRYRRWAGQALESFRLRRYTIHQRCSRNARQRRCSRHARHKPGLRPETSFMCCWVWLRTCQANITNRTWTIWLKTGCGRNPRLANFTKKTSGN